MAGEARRIGNRELFGIFFRSLLIQATWSFERMQSLGFAFSLAPALRRLYPDRGEFESRLLAHQSYFNTQPYLAAFILGAAARLEEERASGVKSDADISAVKETLMAPLGALGDSFFWGALKPMSAAIAAGLLLTGSIWAPVLYLVVYNMVHLSTRAGVLWLGYKSGGDTSVFVTRYNFSAAARIFKAISLSVLGGVVGMITLWRPEITYVLSLPGPLLAAGAMVSVAATAVLMRRGASPVGLITVFAVICLIVALSGAMK